MSKGYIEYRLKDGLRDSIVNFAERLNGTPQETAPLLANYIRSALPEEAKQALNGLHDGKQAALLLLRNLPIDRDIPLEGTIEQRLEAKGQVSQRIIAAFSYLIGAVIIANPKEQGGKLIHDVAPDPAKLHTRSSLGVEPLDPHTESPQEDNAPHYLMLLGLKGDPHAATSFIPVAKVLEKLSPREVSALQHPWFELRSGASYTEGATTNIRPIIQERKGRVSLHYIRDANRVFVKKGLTINKAYEAHQAIQALNKAIEETHQESKVEITLQAGDAIIFNNGELANGVIHARAGKIEDKRRWLQRAFLYEDADIYKEDNTAYLTKTLKSALHRESVLPVKEVSAVLREVMLNTDSIKAYKAAHPEATDSQALLNGDDVKPGKSSWVERIAQEALIANTRGDAAWRKQ